MTSLVGKEGEGREGEALKGNRQEKQGVDREEWNWKEREGGGEAV